MARELRQWRGCMGTLIGAGFLVIAACSSAVAQDETMIVYPQGKPAVVQGATMSLRPHEAATATQTVRAGKMTLDGEPLSPLPPLPAGEPIPTGRARCMYQSRV